MPLIWLIRTLKTLPFPMANTHPNKAAGNLQPGFSLQQMPLQCIIEFNFPSCLTIVIIIRASDLKKIHMKANKGQSKILCLSPIFLEPLLNMLKAW